MLTLIVAGIVFIFILIVGHEFGHFIAAKLLGMRVDEFGIGFPPRLFSKKIKETEYSINLLPFGGFVRIYGESAGVSETSKDDKRSFSNQSALKRVIVVISGVLMNFLIGWLALSIVFAAGTPTRLIIDNVAQNSPAETAGLKSGQYIEGYSSVDEFIGFVDSNKGSEITVNGLNMIPRENPPEGEGPLGVVLLEGGIQKESIIKSIVSGLISSIKLLGLITGSFVSLFSGLFTGDFTMLGQVTGPVGIFGMIGEATRLGITSFLQFLGIISLNLVVLNLLPFPALDGGRFLFIAIEKIMRRRLSRKVEIITNAIGISLLLLLMVVVTIRDIIKIL